MITQQSQLQPASFIPNQTVQGFVKKKNIINLSNVFFSF